MTDRGIMRLWALIITLAAFFYLRAGLTPGDEVLGGYDAAGLFVPWWHTWREALAAGHLPLWDSSVFAGYPFFANPQVGLFYPPAWLTLIMPVNTAIGWFTALHIAFGGVGMLLFTRSRDAAPHAAGLAGLAFAFSGFMAVRVYVGHIGLIAVLAWAPWLLLASAHAVKRGALRVALIAALAWAGAILAGHTTSTVYLGMLWSAFALLLLLEAADRPRALRQLAVMATLGVALAAVQLIPLLELAGLSQRAVQFPFDEAARWSLPPVQALGLIMPEYFGEPTIVGYWGGLNFEELTLYAGIVPAVAAIAVLGQPTRRAVFWLVLTALGLWLSLGNYGGIYAVLWEVVPGFDLLRVPARAGFYYVFAAPVLLADYLSHERTLTGWVALGGGVLLLGVLAVAAVGGDWGAALLPAADPGQLAHRGVVLRRTLALIGASAALLAAWHLTPSHFKQVPAALLAGLLLFDLWGFGAKFIRTTPTAPAAYWQQAAAAIGEGEGRVIPWGLGLFEQNGAALVGLRSVFGYNALEVGHQQRLASTGGDPRAASYDVLGVHYLLTGWPAEEFATGERPVDTLNEGGAVWVHRRAVTLPLVRHTPEVVAIAEPEAALAALVAPGFDAAQTAIVPTPVSCDNPQPAAITMEAARPGYWRMKVEARDGPAYIILAETDYPGWRALIGGQRVEHQRAYTALKGVCVPQGLHTLEWRFVPASLLAGAAVTLIALAGVGAGVRLLPADQLPEAPHN